MAQQTTRGSKSASVKPLKPKNLRLIVDQRVLAERNQVVMPVGAWVESGHECQVHPTVSTVQALLKFDQSSLAWGPIL